MAGRYKFLKVTFPSLRLFLFEVPVTASALSASLLSLSLAGVFSKFQGEGPTKRSCERPIKKPVESTRLTRADIFARMYFPIHGHSLHSQLSCPTQGRYYGFYDYCWRAESEGRRESPPVPEASLGDLSSFINSFCRNGILGPTHGV